MYQTQWLRGIVDGTDCPGIFNKGLWQCWGFCTVEDDTDALGCVLMGGEL